LAQFQPFWVEDPIKMANADLLASGWYREVLTELPDIRNGFIYPMTGPGLGTKLQPERLTAADCERRMTKT
jgi:L-alanine-DL-glutamate epimerase-like enolase superfamily enzyme